MQELIEFEIYSIDRNHINKIKQRFGFTKDEQAIVFCLTFVGENLALVKQNINRYRVNGEKVMTKLELTKNNAKTNAKNLKLVAKND